MRAPHFYPDTLLKLWSVILPDADKTLLLRACLCTPNKAQAAWGAWLARVDDPKAVFRDDQGGLKGLLPFVMHRLPENGIWLETGFQTYLRVSAVRESLRSQIYREILHEILTAIRAAGIETIVLKGAAFSETVYESPALRHNHGIDLLVEPGDASGLIATVRTLGFSSARPIRPGLCRWELIHHTGLPLVVHTRLIDFPYFELSLQSVRERTLSRSLSGVEATILSPEDSFLHICSLAAAFPSRSNLRWICDCWSILRHHRAFDWELLLTSTARGHLAWPVRVITAYFADELDLPIPQRFRDALQMMTNRAGRNEYEPAFAIALTALRSRTVLSRYLRGDWKSQARYLKFALFPSPAYMRWKHADNPAPLPLLYATRPVRHLIQRVSQIGAAAPTPTEQGGT